MSGTAIIVLIGVVERFTKKQTSWKYYSYLMLLLVFYASFLAWQDAKQVPRPKIAGIRLIQEPIFSSPYQDAPYGLKIAMQTDLAIQPFNLKIKCDVPLQWANLDMILNLSSGLSYETPLNNSYIFQYHLDDKAFIPEIPLSIRLWSKEAITGCHRT
jgi:hypothetical protein